MKLLCYTLPVLLMGLAACSKHEGIPTECTYQFVNQSGVDITLDLYGSKADYLQNTSRLVHYTIAHGANFPVVLEVGKSYWMDWYNDNYTISNWRGTAGTVLGSQIQLSAAEGGDTRTIGGVLPDTIRSVVLGGGSAFSEWRGTDQSGQTHRFVFRKDFTGLHEYGFPSSTTTTDSINYEVYMINTTGSSTLQFTLGITRMQLSILNAACNLMYYPPITGRDSLIITGQGGGYFVRRQ